MGEEGVVTTGGIIRTEVGEMRVLVMTFGGEVDDGLVNLIPWPSSGIKTDREGNSFCSL
jgi:hypothetical protein